MYLIAVCVQMLISLFECFSHHHVHIKYILSTMMLSDPDLNAIIDILSMEISIQIYHAIIDNCKQLSHQIGVLFLNTSTKTQQLWSITPSFNIRFQQPQLHYLQNIQLTLLVTNAIFQNHFNLKIHETCNPIHTDRNTLEENTVVVDLPKSGILLSS